MRLALEHFNSLISLVNHFNNDKRCRDFITEQNKIVKSMAPEVAEGLKDDVTKQVTDEVKPTI